MNGYPLPVPWMTEEQALAAASYPATDLWETGAEPWVPVWFVLKPGEKATITIFFALPGEKAKPKVIGKETIIDPGPVAPPTLTWGQWVEAVIKPKGKAAYKLVRVYAEPVIVKPGPPAPVEPTPGVPVLPYDKTPHPGPVTTAELWFQLGPGLTGDIDVFAADNPGTKKSERLRRLTISAGQPVLFPELSENEWARLFVRKGKPIVKFLTTKGPIPKAGTAAAAAVQAEAAQAEAPVPTWVPWVLALGGGYLLYRWLR